VLRIERKVPDIECTVYLDNRGEHPQCVSCVLDYCIGVEEAAKAVISAGRKRNGMRLRCMAAFSGTRTVRSPNPAFPVPFFEPLHVADRVRNYGHRAGFGPDPCAAEYFFIENLLNAGTMTFMLRPVDEYWRRTCLENKATDVKLANWPTCPSVLAFTESPHPPRYTAWGHGNDWRFFS
jgi:hypothetical protein